MNAVQIQSDLRLVLDRIPIGFSAGRLQRPIVPGRIGLHIVGGRVRDRDGVPRIYTAGERPAMLPLASRLYGIPGLGHVDQEVVEFAVNAGRVLAIVSHTLYGISEDDSDPAQVKLVADFKLRDPVALLEQLPDWREASGIDEMNRRINARVSDAAEMAVATRVGDPAMTQSYLSASDISMIQGDFRAVLDRTFREWGLEVLDAVPPTRQFPRALVRILYDLRLGATNFQLQLQRNAARAAAAVGVREYEAQRLAGLGPLGLFVDVMNNRPDVAIKMIEANGQASQATAQILRTVLLTTTADSELSKRVLTAALQQAQGGFMPAFGGPQPGGSAPVIPGLGPAQTPIPGMGLDQGFALLGMAFNTSAPTVVAGVTPDMGGGTDAESARLSMFVDDELARLQQPGVEVEKIGGPQNGSQVVEVMVDDSVMFRMRIGTDLPEMGPRIDSIVVNGVKKKGPALTAVLPAWRKGDHIDVVIALARSGLLGDAAEK